jgi:hypothetical protein
MAIDPAGVSVDRGTLGIEGAGVDGKDSSCSPAGIGGKTADANGCGTVAMGDEIGPASGYVRSTVASGMT